MRNLSLECLLPTNIARVHHQGRFKHSNMHSISTYFVTLYLLGSSKTFFREKNLIGQPFQRGGQKCNKSDDKVTLFFNGVMPHKGVKLHGFVGPYKDRDNMRELERGDL